MSRRQEKVASVVRRVVGEAIAQQLHDPRISPMTSITRVEISGDLQFATVWVSVMGSEGEQRTTIAGLQHAQGRLQSLLSRALAIRQCPALRFKLDQSIKRGFETLRLIDQAMAELDQRQSDDPQAPHSDSQPPGESA
ncbi:MAG TPA: 30S ribosome-binding factor RbfA [Phycisphaerae bacterium]|nr:30S ribosome-binding factor RbfA [Phycisphaerae bacterium]